MGVAHGQAVDQLQQLAHVVFRFAGKARDDIRAQAHDGPVRGQRAHGMLQHGGGVVAAPHAFEHRLTAVLQRNMQVRAEHAAGKQGVQPLLIELAGFQRTDAQAGLPGKFRRKSRVKRAQQFPEVARIRAASVLAQIDARNHDFRMACLQQTARLGNDFIHRAAARFAAGRGNNAVGAAVGAAVLHFQYRAGALEGGNLKWRKCLIACLRLGLCGRRGGNSGRRCGSIRHPGGLDDALAVKVGPWAMQQAAFFFLRHKQIRGGPNGAGARFIISKQPRCATGENQARGGSLSAQAEHGIARVPLALGGDGATVDAHHIRLGRGAAFHAALGKPGFAQ